MCLAFAAHFAFFVVNRRPSTVNRQHTPPALCATSPNCGEVLFPFSIFHSLSTLPAFSALSALSALA